MPFVPFRVSFSLNIYKEFKRYSGQAGFTSKSISSCGHSVRRGQSGGVGQVRNLRNIIPYLVGPIGRVPPSGGSPVGKVICPPGGPV